MSIKNLDVLFNPKRIAVIGAGEDKRSIGYHVFRNLIGKGFGGIVYPVSDDQDGVQGVEAYRRVGDIPHPIDLAMVAVHPEHLYETLIDCGKKGVKGIVVLAPDYTYRLQDAYSISDQVRKMSSLYGSRVLGPNSLGFLRPSKNLNASLYSEMRDNGNIAFISESGIFSSVFLQYAISKKIGFSYFISLGSKLDINISDLIDFLGADGGTRAIFLLVQKINNGRRFVTAIRSFAKTKPIVVVKPGKTDIHPWVSITHSDFLSEEELIYEAVFKRVGSLRVKNMVDLLYLVETIAKQNRPKGKRLLIVSNSITPSEIAIDVLKEMGGILAVPNRETLTFISKNLKIKRSSHNPVYLLEDAGADEYRIAAETCLKDTNIDGVLVICIPFPGVDRKEIASALATAAKSRPRIPLFITWYGEETGVHEIDVLTSKGIPASYTPEQAVKSFMYMYQYDYNLKLLQETPEDLVKDFAPDLENAERIIKKSMEEKRFVLNEVEAVSLLGMYGIPVVESVRVEDVCSAMSTSTRIGYPVVMKIKPSMVQDKQAGMNQADQLQPIKESCTEEMAGSQVSENASSDSTNGGVLLNLKNKGEVKKAFTVLQDRLVSLHEPYAQIVVQPMVFSLGYQLAVGAKKSRNFGTVILFGLGGRYVRVEKDYTIGLPPLNQTLARRMMEETKIYQYLQAIPSYRDALRRLEEMLVRFSQLLIDLPQIAEIDINPVLISDKDGIKNIDVEIFLDRRLPREYRWSKGDLCPLHLSIPPYPFKYEREFLLKDGTVIHIRPVRGEDELDLGLFFEQLSDESVYFRFGLRRISMPHDALARFCQVDYDRDFAFLAVMVEPAFTIIGDVRLNRFADLESAELSFVVGDQWQGRGIGSIMMEYCLSVAKEIGVKTLWMEIMKNNLRMITLSYKYGFKRLPTNEDDDMSELVLNIA